MTGLAKVARRAWAFGMPEGTPAPLLWGFRLFLGASVALWVGGAMATAQIRDGAVVAALTAPMLWCTAFIIGRIEEGRRERERHQADLSTLILQNGDLYRRIPQDDLPPLLREASGH
jgi:hypothetical protein